jgi:ABC-type uncharacterized transport system permease subunit
VKTAVRSILSALLGLALGLLVVKLVGESPLAVLRILGKGAFGSPYDFGMTLFYATPLVFTGLAVALPFRAGLFNIGAEGQLTLGALAAAAVGVLWPRAPFAPVVAGLAAFAGGALWGAIPGWLRAKRGSHEVINTIMLNFIASGIASYVTLYWLKNPDSQNPETATIGSGYFLAHLSAFGDAPVSAALWLALAAALATAFFFNRTSAGFEMRAVGQSELAAETNGISLARARILAMALGGGMAGLVGVGEVLGNAHRFKFEFSPGYGFTGIAVALLARGNPVGILFSALLFGALHKGAADLDMETDKVTRDLSLILEALIILCVSAEGIWDLRFRRKDRCGKGMASHA